MQTAPCHSTNQSLQKSLAAGIDEVMRELELE